MARQRRDMLSPLVCVTLAFLVLSAVAVLTVAMVLALHGPKIPH